MYEVKVGAVEAALQPDQLHTALTAAAAAQQDWDRITGGYANRRVPDSASAQSGATSLPLSQASLATAAPSAPATALDDTVAAAAAAASVGGCTDGASAAGPAPPPSPTTAPLPADTPAGTASGSTAPSPVLTRARQTTAAVIATAMGETPDSPTEAAAAIAALAVCDPGAPPPTPFANAAPAADLQSRTAPGAAASGSPNDTDDTEPGGSRPRHSNGQQAATDLPAGSQEGDADTAAGVQAVAEQQAAEAAQASKPAAVEAAEEALGHREEDCWSLTAGTTGMAVHLYSADHRAAPSVTVEVTDLAATYHHHALPAAAAQPPPRPPAAASLSACPATTDAPAAPGAAPAAAAAAAAASITSSAQPGAARIISGGGVSWSRLTVRLHDGLQESALAASFAAAAAMQAAKSPGKAAAAAAADVMDRSASGSVARAALQQRQSSGSLARLDRGGSAARLFRGSSMQAVQRGPGECGLGGVLKHGSSGTLGDDLSSGSSGGTLGLGHGLGRHGSLRRRQRGMGSGRHPPAPFDGHSGPLGIGGLGRGALQAR